jgi:hypothetical protein
MGHPALSQDDKANQSAISVMDQKAYSLRLFGYADSSIESCILTKYRTINLPCATNINFSA